MAQEVSSDTEYRVLQLPTLTRWRQQGLAPLALLAGVLWLVATDGATGFVVCIILAGILGVFFSYGLRCPHCRRRLQGRRVPETRTVDRIHYDCPDCRIEWRSTILESDWN